MILVYITNPSMDEAKRIAKILLEKRFVVCANMFPVESMYWWEDKIVEDNEVVLIVKTLENKYPELIEEVKKIHPYSVPCIIKISGSANLKYLNWLKEEVE